MNHASKSKFSNHGNVPTIFLKSANFNRKFDKLAVSKPFSIEMEANFVISQKECRASVSIERGKKTKKETNNSRALSELKIMIKKYKHEKVKLESKMNS